MALLALLLAALITWGATGEYRLRKSEENWSKEKINLQKELIRRDEIISKKDVQLDDVRNRLFDYYMREKEVQTNDSIIRKSSTKDINKVLP